MNHTEYTVSVTMLRLGLPGSVNNTTTYECQLIGYDLKVNVLKGKQPYHCNGLIF